MQKQTTITKENIHTLVETFYPTILADELVSPFFIEKIGADISSDNWQKHLDLLADFWAYMALGDMSYTGSPLAPHFDMPGLTKEAFARWLELFGKAVEKVYTPEAGKFFVERSANIADNFMRNLGI